MYNFIKKESREAVCTLLKDKTIGKPVTKIRRII